MPLDTALWTFFATLAGGLFYREQLRSPLFFAMGFALTLVGILLFSQGTAIQEPEKEPVKIEKEPIGNPNEDSANDAMSSPGRPQTPLLVED